MLMRDGRRVGFRKGVVVSRFQHFYEGIDSEQSGGVHFAGTDQAARDQSWRFDCGGC